MNARLPSQVLFSAFLQILSGLLNVFLVSWLFATVAGGSLAALGGSATAAFTCCPFGALAGVCGFVSILLVPIGILEIVAGIMGIANSPSGVGFMRHVAWMEIVSVLFGGAVSFFVGLVVLVMLRSDEVRHFVEDRAPTP